MGFVSFGLNRNEEDVLKAVCMLLRLRVALRLYTMCAT